MARIKDKGLEPELKQLEILLERSSRYGLAALSDKELFQMARLYRFAATRVSQYETEGRSLQLINSVRSLTARAHGLLAARGVAAREGLLQRIGRFYLHVVPTAIRSEWKLITASFVLLYGLAAIAWIAVARDLDTAWALFDPNVIASEIDQLQKTAPGEPFRGNFTFGLDASAPTSGLIMAHNMFVGVMFFAAALVPPVYVYVLATNGLMLGTYIGVAGHYDQAGAISSILWCHGTLELQAIVIAGAAGLVLVRAWVAPGAWSRRHALRLEGAKSWRLLAAMFPMLFFAGLIEGFVSPHVSHPTRVAVAIASGVILIAWIGLGGRGATRRNAAARTAPTVQ
ncbi:MAG: stage II sporulation protein M [Planctomycetes bacterium]|nr:stage II sporulation protein M [Planctomycetota bacterium]